MHDCLGHYQWGDNCDGWILVDEPGLSVKKERMPAGTSEEWHYHKAAQQFFYILKGTAVFETMTGTTDQRITVAEHEGMQILPGEIHRISNETGSDLEFILSSQPSAGGDRFTITKEIS